ncbi:hypothetical protein LZ30DRAFT_106812 [Colletotrichum cereale]|nr:hypothetical protein LZ30DRAFT_106812 [Colletotrichum cereale]
MIPQQKAIPNITPYIHTHTHTHTHSHARAHQEFFSGRCRGGVLGVSFFLRFCSAQRFSSTVRSTIATYGFSFSLVSLPVSCLFRFPPSCFFLRSMRVVILHTAPGPFLRPVFLICGQDKNVQGEMEERVARPETAFRRLGKDAPEKENRLGKGEDDTTVD